MYRLYAPGGIEHALQCKKITEHKLKTAKKEGERLIGFLQSRRIYI